MAPLVTSFLFAAAIAAAPTPAPPAQPAPVEAPMPIQVPGLTNPWNAVGLSAAGNFLTFGAGAGQVYAGEPVRGLLVCLGGPLALVGGYAGGYYLASSVYRRPGSVNADSLPGTAANLGMVTAMLLYAGWSCYDAYQTTERQNRLKIEAYKTRLSE